MHESFENDLLESEIGLQESENDLLESNLLESQVDLQGSEKFARECFARDVE